MKRRTYAILVKDIDNDSKFANLWAKVDQNHSPDLNTTLVRLLKNWQVVRTLLKLRLNTIFWMWEFDGNIRSRTQVNWLLGSREREREKGEKTNHLEKRKKEREEKKRKKSVVTWAFFRSQKNGFFDVLWHFYLFFSFFGSFWFCLAKSKKISFSLFVFCFLFWFFSLLFLFVFVLFSLDNFWLSLFLIFLFQNSFCKRGKQTTKPYEAMATITWMILPLSDEKATLSVIV